MAVSQPSFGMLGSDLALTRSVGTASAAPLDSADSWGGLDLGIVVGSQRGLAGNGVVQDLKTLSGRENLAQALILRLLTPVGSLGRLGHPAYGSRLVELIGRANDEITRNLARLYALQALREEARIEKVVDLVVRVSAAEPNAVQIAFSVMPRDDETLLSLGIEVSL